MYVCMHGHMCHMCICNIFIYLSCYLIHCPVPTSTFLGVLFCPSHACLDLLSIEAPDSEIHEPPGDRWCGLPHHYPANRESMEFLKHKATEKSRLIKSDCETVTASRNKEVVCMYARCHTSCWRFTACIATYKLNMLQQKDRKCWPHRKHGPQAFVMKPPPFTRCQKAI